MQEKIDTLKEDLVKIESKLQEFTQLKFKVLGAIEVLESMSDSGDKKVEDGK